MFQKGSWILSYINAFKKIVALIIAIIFISGCANLEFAYKTNKSLLKIKGLTYLFVEGSESREIYSYTVSSIGGSNESGFTYKLLISSKKTILAEVIEKDATASKFSIEYTIIYNLFNAAEGCKIFTKKISNKDFYDSVSEGYSFGSDFAKEEVSKKLIYKNVDQFLYEVGEITDLKECISEN